MSKIRYLFAKLILKIQIPAITGSSIHSTSRVCAKSHVFKSTIDSYSYVGYGCNVFHTSIGKYCSIADGCFLGGAMHPIENVSSSPVFHKGKNIMGVNFAEFDDPPAKGIRVGNDVWIGANVLVKDGVTIGDGAVVAMGSVVTKDIEPYTIVAGVPAVKIKNRFDDDTISKMKEIKWWDWNVEKIKLYAQFFEDVDKFIEKVSEEN